MPVNPFEVTKAVDFTDAEIAETWVDLPGGGFTALANPKSPMPRFLVGGKGGGRTHLLRFFSYALQRVRHQRNVLAGVRREGYIGVYFRCGGLNSSRFAGKRQDDDTWAALFSYYTEVWLGRLTIDLLAELLGASASDSVNFTPFVAEVLGLFDTDLQVEASAPSPLIGLAKTFQQLQRQLDLAINNAALTHRLDVRIAASPGRLVFGIPAAAARHLTGMRGVVFAYLLDEYENLTRAQQEYVNTLIREKQLPTSFLIGSRLYGLRTHGTLSAGEENRRGSEYDLLVLEDAYRAKAHPYKTFCSEIVRKRLTSVGAAVGGDEGLERHFQVPSGSVERRALEHTLAHSGPTETRPWLRSALRAVEAVSSAAAVKLLQPLLECPDSPLHEKFGLFLFYREWADGMDLKQAAEASHAALARLRSRKAAAKLETTYKHYKHDLYAQILADLRLPQEYFGFGEFVRMSGYLPRNLLVVLKQITRWSEFLGEDPFRRGQISLRAQQEGVREASAWFLADAKSLGRQGEETHLGVRRLATWFREMRFSSKPVEVSCSAFATDRQGLSSAASQCLNDAVSHSLLLEVPVGRRERNTKMFQHKYQLNPMLAPLFDLSLALRGVVNLSGGELTAIFDSSVSDAAFGSVRHRVLSRMQAPFGGSLPSSGSLF